MTQIGPRDDCRPPLVPYDRLVALLTRWLRGHPQVTDAVFAFVLLLPGLAIVHGDSPVAPSVVIVLVMTGALVVRRRWPIGVYAVVVFAALVQWAANIPVRFQDVTILIALYTVAAYGRSRRATLVAGAVTVGGALLAVVRWHGPHLIGEMIVPTAITFVALALGDDRRTRRAYLAALEERAERLERERGALAAVAASTERARIARELHDVVAHSLSVMVAQSDGAAYTIDGDPQRARRAMETVAETGRDALAEMRRLLGVLRPTQSSGDLLPQPGIGAIPELVDRVRGAGLPIELSIHGRPSLLPAGMELAAYRIVQEALTNTLKHSGPGATASIALRYCDDGLVVEVDDDGVGVPPAGEDSTGQGLVGMRERAAMYGGTLRAGPLPTGGFAVTARFPFEIATA
jgi:signal transduction histidine kinase